MNVNGKRARGCRRKTWDVLLRDDLRVKGRARDRAAWKATIRCTTAYTSKHGNGCKTTMMMMMMLAQLRYEERLKETGLCTLKRRWLRGDMIEMLKIMKGIDKISTD